MEEKTQHAHIQTHNSKTPIMLSIGRNNHHTNPAMMRNTLNANVEPPHPERPETRLPRVQNPCRVDKEEAKGRLLIKRSTPGKYGKGNTKKIGTRTSNSTENSP